MNLNRIQQDLVRLYGRSQNVRGAGPKSAPGAAGAEDSAQAAQRSDDVVLSETAATLRRTMGAVASAPDVREAFVAELKGRVQSGNYRVADEALARRILEAGVLD